MDASITPLRHSGLSLVQTTDFFYPLVEDPYMQVSGMIHPKLERRSAVLLLLLLCHAQATPLGF